MSQVSNVVASSSQNEKRPYRSKGHAMSTSERQQSFLERKKETHKEIRVLIPKEMKARLQSMCSESGLSQAEMISRLIQDAS